MVLVDETIVAGAYMLRSLEWAGACPPANGSIGAAWPVKYAQDGIERMFVQFAEVQRECPWQTLGQWVGVSRASGAFRGTQSAVLGRCSIKGA